MKKEVIFLLALLVSSTISIAQQQTQDTLRKIELPATYVLAKESVSSKETEIFRPKLIKRFNQAKDLPFLLNQLSSMVVSSDAGAGTGYSSIRMRGTDITRINVTMNGIPVNDPESQATYFVNTPDLLSSATQVEISKGIGNSKNGNASFGGSISLNNLDLGYSKPYISYQSDFGSFNTFKNTTKLSTGLIQNKFISTIRLSSILSSGYILRSNSNLKSSQVTSKYIFKPGTQVVFNYLKGKEKTGQAWNGVPQDSLKQNRRFNELGLKSDGTYYNNQTDNYGQDYYQLFFDHKVNNQVNIGSALFYTKGKGYYEEYKMQQQFATYGLSNFVLGNDTLNQTDLIRQLWLDNDFYGGRAYLTYLSDKSDAGIYLNVNQYQGRHFGEIIWADYGIPNKYKWYNLTSQKTDMNLYAMLDHRLSKSLSIFVDMQVRKVQYQINGFRNNPNIKHDLNFLFFNPKFSINWQHANHKLNLMMGAVQKEPNREDIEAGTENLPKPEKLFNLELKYDFRVKNYLAILNSYLMYYKDQLILTGKINDVGAYTRTNVPKSFRAGIEVEQRISNRVHSLELAFNASLSMNQVLNFSEYIDDYDNGGQIINKYSLTDIAFSPNTIIGGRVSIFPMKILRYKQAENFSIDLMPKYVSRQFLDNTSNTQKIIPSFFMTDVVINCPFVIKKQTALQARIGLYNVLNHLYESNGYTFSYVYNQRMNTQNYYFPQAGFHWLVGIGIEF